MNAAAGTPELSLVIITRNRRDELRQTLLTLAAQDAPFELVVVDNGSDDGTPAMVEQTVPDAVLVRLSDNAGVSGGRNRGAEAASGSILVFLDDDATFAKPDALSRFSQRFAADPGLGVVAANSYLTATGKPEREAIPRRDKRVIETDYETSYFCGVGFAVRRGLFEEAGQFYEPFVYGCEELDLSWRIIEQGYRIVRAADIVVRHRRSPLERPQGRWVYSNAKNRIWLSARHLPWFHVFTYASVWWTFLLWMAIKNGLVGDYFKGVTESLGGLPAVLKERKRLSKSTLTIIREKNGRLYC